MSTAHPQPAPGAAPALGPLRVPTGELRTYLGVPEVNYVQGQQRSPSLICGCRPESRLCTVEE